MKKLFLISLIFLIFSPKEKKWENLIINNSLDGWHIFQDDGTKKGWSVKDNILIFDTLSGLESGQADASILSNKMYSSFEIVFDWKIEVGGNSGFMWGVREDAAYKFPYQTGQEIQIIDVAAYETPEQILGGEIELNNILRDLDERKHYLGAVYDLYAPTIKSPPNPAGQWNTYHIKIVIADGDGRNDVLSFLQTTPTVPVPIKGSSIVAPSAEKFSTTNLANSSG